MGAYAVAKEFNLLTDCGLPRKRVVIDDKLRFSA